MNASLILAPLLALALASPAQAQTTAPAGKTLQVTPAMRAKVMLVDKNIISTTKLTSDASKKSFIAKQIQLDPTEIGLSQPIMLRPPRGELFVANKVSIGGNNLEIMSPASDKYRVRNDGVVSIVITATDSNWREGLFLVSVTMYSAARPTKVETTYTMSTGPRSTGRSNPDQHVLVGEQTFNFVTQADSDQRKAYVSISGVTGEDPWELRSVEITPIER